MLCDRGDAEGGGYAALREEFGHQIADGVVARHLKLLPVGAKLKQVVWSVNQCAVWYAVCGCPAWGWSPCWTHAKERTPCQPARAKRPTVFGRCTIRCFVIGNAWDAGSARLLTGVGFVALATSSGAAAGGARAAGWNDYARRVAGTCARDRRGDDLPVSADLEKGFGDAPARCGADHTHGG